MRFVSAFRLYPLRRDALLRIPWPMSGTPISSMRSLGPAFEADCHRAGIMDAETLREIGAEAAYRRLLESGTKPHFIWFYVLVMSLQGRPWNDAKGAEKDALRLRFDTLKAEVRAARLNRPDALHPDLEAALDLLGVVPLPPAAAQPRRG